MIGSPIDGRSALAPPTGEGADAPVSPGGPSVLCFLRTSKLTAGFFPRGTREGACKKKLSKFQEKLREEELINSYTIPVWLGEQREAASLPLAYARRRPPLVREWHPQFQKPSAGPSLDLHETNRKSVPLVKFLRIRRPAAARKKSFSKNFSLGSQFNGSRSLDLLLLFSGPFIDSVAPRRGSEPVFPHSNQGHRPNLIPGVGRGSRTSNTSVSTFFNGRHETRPIIETVLPQIPGLLGGLLNRVNQAKCPGRAGINVVPGRGHNLRWCELVLIQDLLDLWVQRKTKPVVKGCPVYDYTLGGRLIHGSIRFGKHEGALCGQELGDGLMVGEVALRAVLRVRASWSPGNSSPSATISVTGGIRPVCLGTEPTDPVDGLVGELVEAPSEDELREECPDAELHEPDREEVLELEEAASASGFDGVGIERGLPSVPSASNSSGD
ncbi:LOW QUALITY PROTEIN: hypothetical protein Cgig2_009647 [Carnegiea gigantea]|uniref:Uncharacterized protein n=1 Tax=Carnegiea gigantea TaxID=171969 RepID=A0A9Q1K2R6_9CARY|nr:LOW QUALITY PROTEIN: hypothetical protein Cgig2_009647 [Carnegiea gigantea]